MVHMVGFEEMFESSWSLFCSCLDVVNWDGRKIDGFRSVIEVFAGEVFVDSINNGDPSYHRSRHDC